MAVKIALVTGGSGGIGKSVSLMLSHKYNVAVNYNNNESEAQEIVSRIISDGGRAKAYKADVSDNNQVLDMVRKINDDYGEISVVVNNAGISEQILFTDITDEKWDRMFDVNVKGAFHVIKAVLPDMIRNKYGRIINISSMWGVSGGSCEVHYSASKAALIGLTKALAKEEGPSGITVNCIAPGVIDTKMNSHLDEFTMNELIEMTPVMKIGKPDDVARAVMFFASQETDFITGQVLCVDGGITV